MKPLNDILNKVKTGDLIEVYTNKDSSIIGYVWYKSKKEFVEVEEDWLGNYINETDCPLRLLEEKINYGGKISSGEEIELCPIAETLNDLVEGKIERYDRPTIGVIGVENSDLIISPLNLEGGTFINKNGIEEEDNLDYLIQIIGIDVKEKHINLKNTIYSDKKIPVIGYEILKKAK